MNIRPVRSEQEYDTALKQIEKLWGAEPGTAEGDKLDVLLALVGVYEDKNHPVPPPSPIEAIKFAMDQKGLKPIDLVPHIGSRSKVSEILSGKRTLTLSMIRALHAQLGIPAEVLIQDGRHFPSGGEAIPWNSFPTLEIVSRGWVTGFDSKTQAEEIMRTLARQAGADDYFLNQSAACLRQGTRRNKKDNPHSVSAWILCVLAQAQKSGLAHRYDPSSIDASTIAKVGHLSVLKDGPLLAREYLTSKGIKMVVVPHFKKSYLDGAVMIGKKETPIIALTLRYDRLDYFWFTLSHELAHLVLGHVHAAEGRCITDDLELTESLDDKELRADQLAKESLIPSQLWQNHPAITTMKTKDVLDLARKAEVHPAIVAGRIRHEKRSYGILSKLVGQGQVRHLFCD